jgi:bacteriocin biosynthesis cyclodehydratase domain-containing protein
MSSATTFEIPAGRTYPLLRPQTPILRRGPDQVQIGVDQADAVVLAGVGDEFDWFFTMLDGCHHVRAIDRACAARKQDTKVVSRLIRLLEAAGLLLEGGRSGRRAAGPPLSSRVRLVGAGRLGTSIAELLVDSGVGTIYLADSEPVDRRAHPTAGAVASNGDALASELATRHGSSLSCSQIRVLNHWSKPDGARPDLTVVATDSWECDRVVADVLVRSDQPHLFVRQRGTGVVVGPLVVPGQTACLRCTDLARTAADPAWPTLLRQLCRVRGATEPALAAWAAGTAATHVLAYLNGEPPESYGQTLEMDAADYRSRTRSWAAHPGCGCCWRLPAEWGP